MKYTGIEYIEYYLNILDIENEFNMLFTALPEIHIILLYKHMIDFDLWDNTQKEWQEMFKYYVFNLDREKFNYILEMAEKVKII